MRFGALVVATVIHGGPIASGRLHAQSPDTLAARVATMLAEEGLVGATWSTVTPGAVSAGAAGLKDASRRVSMKPHDRVQVGSVAKTFVATGVLKLVTQGRVALDAPIARYLPDLPVDNPFHAESPLLVRHFLDQTSGLGDVRLWQVFTVQGDPNAPLSTALVREGQRLRIRSRPGARFTYTNIGYVILGMLIERVTGMRYERWLDEELLKPLGMTQSTFAFVPQQGPHADTTLAMGHFDLETPYPSFSVPVRPAIQFTTTASDMARFAQFLMSDGVVNGRVLVDGALLRAMAVPTTTEAVAAGLKAGYALGLVRRERWGITGKCHLGNMGTFRSILCVYPEHQRAFFVTYNTDPEEAGFDRIDSLIAGTLGVPRTAASAPTPPAIDAARWNGWYTVRPNRFPQFAYLDELGGLTRVKWDGEVLHLRPVNGPDRALQPIGSALFRQAGRMSATHVLARSGRDEFIVSDGQRTLVRVSLGRAALLWISAVLGVLGLAYLLTAGGVRIVRAARRRALGTEPLAPATIVLLLLALAPVLYSAQPFLAIGDRTMASVAMAMLTGSLPLAVAWSLIQRTRNGIATRPAMIDLVALSSALQWLVVLAFWGLVPLILWR